MSLTSDDKKKTRKHNGYGHTYQLPNESWKTVIEKNGRRFSSTHPNRGESRRLAKAKVESAISRNPGFHSPGQKITVRNYMDAWLSRRLKTQAITETTHRRYNVLIRDYINPSIGNQDLSSVTKGDVVRLLNSMADRQQSPRSRQQTRAILHKAFQDALDEELIPLNVISSVPKINVETPEINPLTRDEVRLLLHRYQGDFMSARLHIALLLGLRQGEALGLRWEDIDLALGVVRVRNQIQRVNGRKTFVPLKTKASLRDLLLTSHTIDALEKHRVIVEKMRVLAGKSWIENDLVFPNSTGGPLDSKLDYKRWQKALKESGIPAHRLHDARHTAATLMLENGDDIEVIKRNMGHSNINMTSRTYLHRATAPLEKSRMNMQTFLDNPMALRVVA
jgi:integrase